MNWPEGYLEAEADFCKYELDEFHKCDENDAMMLQSLRWLVLTRRQLFKEAWDSISKHTKLNSVAK